MLRLILPFLTLLFGFALGIWYDRQQMVQECANGEGEWTGTICVNSELLQ
ncbi:hypothetical protein OS190_03455 [Sulfitobacter sp. F26204]|nr:hypothetical protein [Sulfitobacter sp. F26204]MCX7558608.1 hypothetical protein [Sulfitobacter sp. F26204]